MGHFSQSEVEDFDRAVGKNLDVPRLQVPVDDSFFVRRFKRVRDLPRDANGLVLWERPLPDPLIQCRTGEQLHDYIVRADVIELADVGMIQSRDGAGLALEPFAEAG